VRRFYNLLASRGVLLVMVEPGSPAARAGLQAGDVLVAYDDHSISSVDDLHRLLTEQRVGVEARVTFLRRLRQLTCRIVPETAPPRD
jgi:S1-C subfamily serine protease